MEAFYTYLFRTVRQMELSPAFGKGKSQTGMENLPCMTKQLRPRYTWSTAL